MNPEFVIGSDPCCHVEDACPTHREQALATLRRREQDGRQRRLAEIYPLAADDAPPF